jgi:hypothetical protein
MHVSLECRDVVEQVRWKMMITEVLGTLEMMALAIPEK